MRDGLGIGYGTRVSLVLTHELGKLVSWMEFLKGYQEMLTWNW